MARKGGMATGVEVARISVKVSPDTKQFRRDLQEDLNRIEREVRGNVGINAHLDSAQARADFNRMMEKLKAQGAKGVKIKSEVLQEVTTVDAGGKNKKSKSSSVENDAKKTAGILGKLRDKLLQAPNFGTGINLTGFLVILTAIAAVAAPLAGIVAGLLLTLPGLLSLVLTPIAAITLGLDGMKKAAESLKAPFADLRATMSAAVQDQFTPVFEKLRGVFPSLQDALPAVSQGLSQMFASIVNTVTSDAGLQSIQNTIYQIGGALQGLAPGFGSLTHALMVLAETFTGGSLQGVVEWFNGAMKSFDDWITKASQTGELQTVFKNLGTVLKIVADVLGDIAKIGLDTLNDPEAMMAFTVLLQGVGAALVGFFQVSKAFLHAIGAAAINVAMWITQLQVKLYSIVTTISGWAAEIANAVVNAFTSFVQTATGIWSAIVSTVSAAIGAIVGFVASIPEQVAGYWANLQAEAASLWDGVKVAVSVAWDGIVAAVQNGISMVVSFVASMPGQILGALGDLGSLLVNAGKAAMQGLLNGIKAGAQAVYDFVSGIASKIASLKGPIPKDKVILVPNGEALMHGLGKGLENGFQPVLDQAKSMAGQIAEAFATGADPTQFTEGFTGKEVSRMSKTLGLESKRMGLQAKALDYQAKMAGKGAMADQLKAQADAIRLKKEELDLQREMLDLTKEYAQAGTDGQAGGNQQIQDLLNMPLDFVKANANQALQDIGISGSGFLPTLANTAIDAGSKFIFNVSNMDDALSAQQTLTNRQAQGVVGR